MGTIRVDHSSDGFHFDKINGSKSESPVFARKQQLGREIAQKLEPYTTDPSTGLIEGLKRLVFQDSVWSREFTNLRNQFATLLPSSGQQKALQETHEKLLNKITTCFLYACMKDMDGYNRTWNECRELPDVAPCMLSLPNIARKHTGAVPVEYELAIAELLRENNLLGESENTGEEVLIALALHHTDSGELQQALEVFKYIIGACVDRDNIEVLFHLAQEICRSHPFMIPTLALLCQKSDNPQILVNVAREFYAVGDLANALKIAEHFPDIPQASAFFQDIMIAKQKEGLVEANKTIQILKPAAENIIDTKLRLKITQLLIPFYERLAEKGPNSDVY